MRLSWLGHSCFLIETDEKTKLVTDPYEPGSYEGAVGYWPIGFDPDIATVSHNHPDHAYTECFSKAKIVDRPDPITIKDVHLEGIMTYHDQDRGASRGMNIIFSIMVEGIKVVHLGDLGTVDVDSPKLSGTDILLAPVGGKYTIDAKEADVVIGKINPRVVIPMHYKTPKIGFDIDGVETFLEGKANVDGVKEYFDATQESLLGPKSQSIVVLKYLR